MLFILCGCYQVLHAQHKVNLQLKRATVTEALKKMSAATGYEFFYNSKQLAECTKRVDAHFREVSLTQALQEVLSGTDFTFKTENRTIVILRRSVSEEKKPVEKKEIEIRGKVVDAADHSPMIGVTVVVGDALGGTATDLNGEFVLKLPVDGCDISFSFVGYEPQIKHFNGKNAAMLSHIVMHQKLMEINDVVVTGIYQRKKESFTGASTTFKGDELKSVG